MRGRNQLIITIIAAAAAAASLAVAIPAARADVPQRENFAYGFPYVDTWTCPGMALDATIAVRGVDTSFSETREQVHLHGLTTLTANKDTANEKTVASNFDVLLTFDPTTPVQKITGTVWNIQVPGIGTLLVDAGTIVVDNSTDPPTVLFIGGPHQEFSGDLAALCGYLADP